MKHLLLTAGLLLSVLFPAGAVTISDYPYNPTFAKGAAAGWTTYKGGSGSWSNTVGEGYWQGSVGSGLSNAWLFSPELNVRSGYKYTFSYTVEVGSTNYPKELNQSYLLASPSSSASVVCEGVYTQNSATELSKSATFTWSASEDGSVYFAINHLTNGSDKGWKTNFKNFKVVEEADVMLPNGVSGLTVTPAADGSRSATLTWINPSTYNFGNLLEIAAIEVRRDDQTVGTITDATRLASGAEVSYVDTFPVSGKYTYSVIVRDADGLESVQSVNTPYMGPLDPLTPPYSDRFNDEDTNEFWTIINYKQEGHEEYKGNAWAFSQATLVCSLGGTWANDSWAFSRPLSLEAGKAYRLSFTHRVDNKSNPFPIAITLGATPDKESQTLDVWRDENYQPDVAYTDLTPTFDFSVPETGTYYLGVNSFGKLSSSNYSNKMTIKGVDLDPIPVSPMPVTELTATDAEGDALETTMHWTMPAESETGIALTDLTADIYRDGAKADEVAGEAGQELSWIDSAEKGLTQGFHTYYIVVRNGDAESQPSKTVSTGFLGGPVALPYVSDFENASGLWTVVDNSTRNNKKFEFVGGHAIVDEGSGNKAYLDDWLISPMLDLKAGLQYEVLVTAKGITTSTYSLEIPVEFHLGTCNTIESMAENKVVGKFTNATAPTTFKFAVTPTADLATLGIHVPVPTNNIWGLDISSVTVQLLAQRPVAIADAVALAAANAPEVTVSCTMPTLNDYGNPLPEDALMNLAIAREGVETPLCTLGGLAPGEAVSWTDTQANPGFNKYVLTPAVVGSDGNPGGVGAPVMVMSDYVGDALNLPFVADFANESDLWLQLKDQGNFEYVFDAEGHEGHAYLLAGANEDASATYKNWLVTPPLNLKAGKAYHLDFTARSKPKSSGYAIDYAVYVAKVPTSAELKAGKKISAASAKVSESTLTARSIDFFVEEDGKYFMGYYVDAGTDSAVSEVGEWSVTQQLIVPANPTSVSGRLNEEGKVELTMLVPSKNTMGGALGTTIEARVYRDNDEEPMMTQEVETGKTVTLIVSDTDSRYHSYRLAVAIPDDGESARMIAGTFFAGAALEIPYEADFADAPNEWKISNSSMGDTRVEIRSDGIHASSTDNNSSNIKFYAYSPVMDLSASKAYRMTATAASTGTNTTVKVSLNPVNGDPKILATGVKPTSEGTELTYDFRPASDGNHTVSLYFERGYYNSDEVSLTAFSLAEIPSVPAAPNSYTATEDEGELDLLVSVTLPSLGSLGEVLAEDAELSARVYVNGELVAETETATAGQNVSAIVSMPTNGIHTLGISAVMDGQESAVTEMRTDWVGAGLSVTEGNPYIPTLDADGLEGYTTAKENSSHTGWNIGVYGLQVDGRDGNFWLFTTPFNLVAEHNYRMSFSHKMTTGQSGKLEVFMGSAPTIAAMGTAIGEPIDVTSTKTEWSCNFSRNGQLLGENETDDDAPKRVAAASTRTYIGIKASELTHTSSYTNPRLVLEDMQFAFHSLATGVDAVTPDGIRLENRMLILGTPSCVRVYATDGRLETLANGASAVDLSRLPSGIHLVCVGNYVFKINI